MKFTFKMHIPNCVDREPANIWQLSTKEQLLDCPDVKCHITPNFLRFEHSGNRLMGIYDYKEEVPRFYVIGTLQFKEGSILDLDFPNFIHDNYIIKKDTDSGPVKNITQWYIENFKNSK